MANCAAADTVYYVDVVFKGMMPDGSIKQVYGVYAVSREDADAIVKLDARVEAARKTEFAMVARSRSPDREIFEERWNKNVVPAVNERRALLYGRYGDNPDAYFTRDERTLPRGSIIADKSSVEVTAHFPAVYRRLLVNRV